MSDKVFVGRKAATLSVPSAFDPISKIVILVDPENAYEAGDDTGQTLELTCPYGTQALADNLLALHRGFTYQPLEAGDTLMDPSAELGDGVTIAGVYTMLAEQELEFDSHLVSKVKAPGQQEVESEYPFQTKEQQLERKIARTRSLISKTAAEIRQEVANEVEGLSASFTVQLDNINAEIVGLENAHSELELSLDGLTTRIQDAEGNIADLELTTQEFEVSIEDLEGNYADLALTLDGLTVTDSSGTTRIKGSSIETETLYVDAANINGTLTADQIVLTGSITWNDLSSGVQSTINGAYASDVPSYIKSTYIAATTIKSPTIESAEFNVYPEGESDYLGSFNIYGMYGNAQYHFLSLEYNGYDTPYIYFKSPGGAYAYWDFGYTQVRGNMSFMSAVSFYENVDFSNANVTGLTPKLAS